MKFDIKIITDTTTSSIIGVTERAKKTIVDGVKDKGVLIINQLHGMTILNKTHIRLIEITETKE